jgi:putative FmdB family regulatory protein
MPLYEYECESCGRRFEKIQKFSDPPIEECPSCGKRVRKVVSSPAVHFKGSGWYITDYAKKGSDKGAGEKSTKPAESASDSKGTDAKAGDSSKSTASPATDTKSSTKPTT